LSFSKLVEPGCFFPKLVDPACFFPKLVELTCELCEWVVSKPGEGVRGSWGRVLAAGCGVVSTQPFAGAHVLAQPAFITTRWLSRPASSASGSCRNHG